MVSLQMKRIFSFFIIISCVSILYGCSHRYSAQEYEALQSELDMSNKRADTCLSEKKNLESALDEARKNLDKSSAEVTSNYFNKQQLLDKNIDCMEVNKNLLKQITRLKTQIQEKKEDLWRLNKAHDYLLGFLETERVNDQLYIVKGDDALKIIIPQKSIFPASYSAWVTPRGISMVRKISKGLKELKPLRVEIDGHTDDALIPKQTQKLFPTQWDLSHARALSVLLLLEGQGIQKDRLSIGSYGETRPIAELTTGGGSKMNGRVEIVITP